MAGGYASAPEEAEVARLRECTMAAAVEVSRLRAQAADKEYEASQLEKQIRRLERKIAALESPGASCVSRGFLNTGSKAASAADKAAPTPANHAQADAKPAQPRAGAIIDSTGREVNPLTFWGEEKEPSNLLLRDAGAEASLMAAMRSPPETNDAFDTAKYSQLLVAGRREEAEAMIQTEGGPSLAQMQREPLALLRKHPSMDPNWIDSSYHNCSLLQWACCMGYDEVAKELLARGANPSHVGSKGVSCLAAACAHSSVPCVELLLEARCNVNEVADDRGRQSLMMWAARIDYVDTEGTAAPNPILELLLRHRGAIDQVDDRGQTALMHACTHGSDLAVEALLEARADVDLQDANGDTALQMALRYYHGKISSRLLPLRRRPPSSG